MQIENEKHSLLCLSLKTHSLKINSNKARRNTIKYLKLTSANIHAIDVCLHGFTGPLDNSIKARLTESQRWFADTERCRQTTFETETNVLL